MVYFPKSLEIFEDLKNVLYTDSAVAGEAAGIAMGLVMLGSASDQALDEMLAYAHDTQHEKIIRGLAIGIALVMCGREAEADTLIEQLSLDKVPLFFSCPVALYLHLNLRLSLSLLQGSNFALWCNVYHCIGILRYCQQCRHSTTIARCCQVSFNFNSQYYITSLHHSYSLFLF